MPATNIYLLERSPRLMAVLGSALPSAPVQWIRSRDTQEILDRVGEAPFPIAILEEEGSGEGLVDVLRAVRVVQGNAMVISNSASASNDYRELGAILVDSKTLASASLGEMIRRLVAVSQERMAHANGVTATK